LAAPQNQLAQAMGVALLRPPGGAAR
jgi:hypothetical protein